MTDMNTIMTLMAMLNGAGGRQDTSSAGSGTNGAGANMLPLLLSMMTARGGTENGGAGGMLPLLMNMMGAGQKGADSPVRETPARETDSPARARDYAETPFGEIGFAGSEVRSFMETLWRVRSRG